MATERKRALTVSQLIKLAEMKVLHIEPGDVLVLQTDHVLDKEQAGHLRERAQEQFSTSVLHEHRVVVLTAGLRVGVLRKRKRK